MSVTHLSDYLMYRDEDFMTLGDLLARLRGQSSPSPKMEAGTAFHAILETAQASELTEVSRNGWTFDFRKLDAELPLYPVRELKGSIPIATPSDDVLLVGKVDALGGSVRDYKLTESFDADRYMDAYQWRAYLLMFAAKRFDYDVFEADIDEVERYVTVKRYHPLTMYAYPDMERDVCSVVAELADLIVRHAPDLSPRSPGQEG